MGTERVLPRIVDERCLSLASLQLQLVDEVARFSSFLHPKRRLFRRLSFHHVLHSHLLEYGENHVLVITVVHERKDLFLSGRPSTSTCDVDGEECK